MVFWSCVILFWMAAAIVHLHWLGVLIDGSVVVLGAFIASRF